mmetsp:Transcript_14673/g.42351  ORF Transcript_14673/g.42351 Transcript_14673/m.42351 type:complete len:339 (+) Transcript_14673:869-1885(+)
MLLQVREYPGDGPHEVLVHLDAPHCSDRLQHGVDNLQQAGLHHRWVVPEGCLALRVLVLDADEHLQADRSVGVHHGVLRGDMSADCGEDGADLLPGQLVPEHRDELQARRAQDRPLGDRVRPRQLRRDEVREELRDVDFVVDHRHTVPPGLASDGQRNAQVDAGVLEPLGALRRDLARLIHQRLHIADEDLCDFGFIDSPHCLHQVHGAPPARLLVGALHVPADVLGGVVLEELRVGVAEDDVREDDLLADAGKHVGVVERRLGPSRRGGRGQELDATSHQVVVFLLLVQAHQQLPNVLHTGQQVGGELLLVLVGVQREALAYRGLHLLQQALLVSRP